MPHFSGKLKCAAPCREAATPVLQRSRKWDYAFDKPLNPNPEVESGVAALADVAAGIAACRRAGLSAFAARQSAAPARRRPARRTKPHLFNQAAGNFASR